MTDFSQRALNFRMVQGVMRYDAQRRALLVGVPRPAARAARTSLAVADRPVTQFKNESALLLVQRRHRRTEVGFVRDLDQRRAGIFLAPVAFPHGLAGTGPRRAGLSHVHRRVGHALLGPCAPAR